MRTKYFLSLDDAVKTAEKKFDIDPVYARRELEQKCYMNELEYAIGYHDGVRESIKAISDMMDWDIEDAEI